MKPRREVLGEAIRRKRATGLSSSFAAPCRLTTLDREVVRLIRTVTWDTFSPVLNAAPYISTLIPCLALF